MAKLEFKNLFNEYKPIIGMIHLAGSTPKEKVDRALEELVLYNEEGINGAIIEDYHGTPQDVYETLIQSMSLRLKLVLGVNLLRDPYQAFRLASDFGAKFVQFDSVQTQDIDPLLYESKRLDHPGIYVLGGVGFKYKNPTGNKLEDDLAEGKSRCEAIVTTGPATGIETPIEKLKLYKGILEDFTLIDGSGVSIDNIRSHSMIADGVIMGSNLKRDKNTELEVDRTKVKDFMSQVRGIRAARYKAV